MTFIRRMCVMWIVCRDLSSCYKVILIDNRIYDENIFLFFEESCIGKKFKDLGYKTKLLMDVDYIHNHSVSINKAFNSEAKKRKMTLDSFYTYFLDFYNLSSFQKCMMKAYKKNHLYRKLHFVKDFL